MLSSNLLGRTFPIFIKGAKMSIKLSQRDQGDLACRRMTIMENLPVLPAVKFSRADFLPDFLPLGQILKAIE